MPEAILEILHILIDGISLVQHERDRLHANVDALNDTTETAPPAADSPKASA